jgi:hypothetical protein
VVGHGVQAAKGDAAADYPTRALHVIACARVPERLPANCLPSAPTLSEASFAAGWTASRPASRAQQVVQRCARTTITVRSTRSASACARSIRSTAI